jgi:catechol 2,3-dioxygenase-like lactoylglutathione lyase family enzyme
MRVRRVVANVASSDLAAARRFYEPILGLRAVMDLFWIVTFEADGALAAPQISVASEGAPANGFRI